MARKMKILKCWVVLFFVVYSVLGFANAEQRELPNQLGDYHHFQIRPSHILSNIDFYVVKLAAPYHARLYLQPVKLQSQAKFIGHLEQPFVIAINGSYYSPDFQPVGWFVDKGKTLKRFARNRLLRSCVVINQKGLVTLVPRCEGASSAFYAMQTGPLMIENGKIVEDIANLQAHSKIPASFFSPHERTVLAESTKGELLIVITSDAKLVDVADILQNHPERLGITHIKTAVNLDGGASTGMLIRFNEHPVYIREKKPVKVLVFFG